MAVSDNTLNLLNFRNCKRCNKPFSTILDYTICPVCIDKENQDFNRTRDYIYANPSTTKEDAISNCKIAEVDLDRWIREERIVLSENSPISYPCDACGTKIRNGHFCIDCKIKLHSPTPNERIISTAPRTSMHHFNQS